MIKKTFFDQIPLILSTTLDEGSFNAIGLLKGDIDFDDFNDRWDELGPLLLFQRSFEERSERDIELSRKLRHFYFGNEQIKLDTIKNYTTMAGDAIFYSGIDKTIKFLIVQ